MHLIFTGDISYSFQVIYLGILVLDIGVSTSIFLDDFEFDFL